MSDEKAAPSAFPSLEQLQHWTATIGSAQQMMLEYVSAQMNAPSAEGLPWLDPAKAMKAQADFWSDSMILFQRFVTPTNELDAPAPADLRFRSAGWRDNPIFDLIRQSYVMLTEHLLRGADAIEGLDERQRDAVRFATRAFADAASPANFPFSNPDVLQRTLETGGRNLVTGLERMLDDLSRGQLTHTDRQAFELGRNLATTPGKVIKETPLYQLIQYTPTTETVFATPLVIFPPWINRYYILDLSPEKSFIRWAVEQGLTVFVISWRSADETMRDVTMEDYVERGQIDAIDTVRELLGVPAVHTIGYCVAGTTLAMTLALLAERGEADKVASATFFTAQVDFELAGDLTHFASDEQMTLIETLSAERGVVDGRLLAAAFNLLRGRDLIWNYVVNNYLLGQDYPVFDLLHWNGDVTNLPAGWHKAYMQDLYRDNKLARAGTYRLGETPLDLGRVSTPAYVQAGREDHIAPAESVWRLTHHFKGPIRFVLAGSGHIAGVVNPPSSGKYNYWINDAPVSTLDEFVAGATESKGSWWPDWRGWIALRAGEHVPASGARRPGRGALAAIEDAPGRYVQTR